MADDKGLGHRLLRFLEMVHLAAWINESFLVKTGVLGAIVSAFGWVVGVVSGNESVASGALYGLGFCAITVLIGVFLYLRQRRQRIAEDIASAADQAARQEGYAAARAEAVEEQKRKSAARAIVTTHRDLKAAQQVEKERELRNALVSLSNLLQEEYLTDEERRPYHPLSIAHAKILTAYYDNKPVEEFEEAVQTIARFFGLGDLV